MPGKDKPTRFREERQFTSVLVGWCTTAATFLFLFILLTLIKAARTPSDITVNWFAAWGTWAGGLATAAAFLIAAYSIAVASAHAHVDRQEAAKIRGLPVGVPVGQAVPPHGGFGADGCDGRSMTKRPPSCLALER
jgi:hypothetical protein